MRAGAGECGTLGAAALLAAIVLAGTARAQTPADTDEAKRLTKLSIREYEALEYDRALADAVKAFELSGAPGLLFNLGQCHRALGHWKEAERAYRNYLREQPDAPNRAQVWALIAEMQAKQAAGMPAPAPAAAPGPPAPAEAVQASAVPPASATTTSAEPGRSHALAWTLWGASAVAAGFAITGAVRVADYQSGTSPSSYSGYEQELALRANASNWGTAAIVLGVLAVAGVGGGVLTW